MARAKNTDRAEARRRHRAAVAAAEEAEAAALADSAEAAISKAAIPRDQRAAGVARSTPSAPAQRPGIIQAFRMAAAPADVRGDLRAAPAVLRATPSLWIAPALVVVGGIVLLVPSLRENQIGILVAQLLVVPPPLIPAFLAGMLAPRASWLFGLLVGAFSGLLFSIYVMTAPATWSLAVTSELRSQAFMYALVISPMFGLATGAFAGFYRRFLRISGPQQAARRQSKPAAKSAKPAARSGR